MKIEESVAGQALEYVWNPDERCKEPAPESDVYDLEPLAEHFDGSRSDDQARILKWLVSNPKGVSLVRTVKALFPKSNDEAIADREYSTTDYQFVRRFFKNSEYVETGEKEGLIVAEPHPDAFHLITSKQNSNHDQNRFAKHRAEALLDGIHSLNDVKDAKLLTKEFVKYLRSIDDKRLMLQEETDHSKRLTMPYHTRFNNKHRKDEQWARYNTAWERADDLYTRGVMLTLTTDPKRYDSLLEMLVGLFEAWQDLHEALNQRYKDDTRLDFIRALEFGGSDDSTHVGLPHLHVCIFGVPYIAHKWLKSYWADRHGQIVHIRGMNKRGSESWVISTGEKQGHSAAGYLGKYLSKTMDPIADDPDDMLDTVQSWQGESHRDSELWKLAMYWATGRQLWDSSHELKDTEDPDRLEDISGLGDTKLERLNQHDIHTLSDLRLTEVEEIASINGISTEFAERLKEIVGSPSAFDVYNFEFVGAASWQQMPSSWSASARHVGVSATSNSSRSG